jgi:Ca2+-binding RTX toxin-like protein
MADMTPQEQLMLELINRARLDPEGEAKRFGIKLNEGVAKSDRISTDAKQVLAGNDDIAAAAGNHSEWMLQNDIFSHEETSGSQGFTGKNADDRMEHEGYVFSGSSGWGENIALRGAGGSIDAALSTKLILQQHKDLFVDAGVGGRGHRLNILSEGFREAGVGQETGNYNGSQVSMVTQDYGRSGSTIFVTGVVYDDTVKNDNFFTVGEEQAGIAVDGGAATDTTGAGGGYELAYAAGGDKTIAFTGGVTVSLTLGSRNVKLDLVNGDEIWTNADVTAGTGVAEIHALGIEDVDLTGSINGEALYGNDGRNRLSGLGGNDRIDGGAGKDDLSGGGGADTFVFSRGDSGKTAAKADVITDFSQADGDLIDFTRFDANSKKDGGQSFSFIGDQAFHHKAGELRATTTGGVTTVEGDVDGDGQADVVVQVDNGPTLGVGDFSL